MQFIEQTAVLLGANPAYGRALANLFWKDIYNGPDEARSYRTPDCHNGGRLDLNPNSDVWP
jgi:hypothetical protein